MLVYTYLYLISLQVGALQPVRLAVAGDAQLNEAIVGRDLLNQLVVKLAYTTKNAPPRNEVTFLGG